MKEFKRFETAAEFCARTGADPESFAAMRMAALEAKRDYYVRPAVIADRDRFFAALNMKGDGDDPL